MLWYLGITKVGALIWLGVMVFFLLFAGVKILQGGPVMVGH